MLQKLDTVHMNRLAVAEYLDALTANEFNMSHCSACICGHINKAFLHKPIKTDAYCGAWAEGVDRARAFLGINEEQAGKLFASEIASPHDAARVMRHLAATDTVDWKVAWRSR